MNNEYKTKLQQKTFNTYKDCNRLLIKWATGCGKSKMTIDLLKYTISHIPHNAVILFLVAERSHIKNWQEEFKKWQLSERIKIDILCYNSLSKVSSRHYGVLVMDEAHHGFSDRRISLLETIKADYIYMLSATFSDEFLDIAENIFGKFQVSYVSLKTAINNSILSDPQIYVVNMELDNITIDQRIQIGKGDNLPVINWWDRNKYIYKKKPCIIKCTEYQKNKYFDDSMDYWKRRYKHTHSFIIKNKWVNLGSQRKKFLGELKTNHVKVLLDKLKKHRLVCFCSSIAQATQLSESTTISSKRSSKENQRLIDSFNAKEINSLFTVGMITEGVNLVDTQIGIIIQLDGHLRLFIQKLGRVLRSNYPVVYIFVYKGTQDEIYLNKALKNINEKSVKYINVNSLKFME